MADRIKIDAQPRTVTGKQVRQLRRNDLIPAVIYGQLEPLHIQMENLSLRRMLRDAGGTRLIDITLDGSQRTVLAREIQRHPTRGDLLHVDFFEVNMREKVASEVELLAVGEAAPEEEGLGSVILVLHSIDIECLPDDLISEIQVDRARITSPEDILHVRDLSVPAGITVLTPGDTVVAKFQYALAEEPEGAEGDEEVADTVEVITKGKKDEDED